MSELPQGWNMSRFGDICGASQYGWTTKAVSQGSVKYLRTTDISKRKIDWDSVPYCQENPSDIEKYQIQKNDILISRSGSVGFSALIRDISSSTVFASYLIRFLPSKKIEPRYVAHFLRSPKYWQQISNASTGIALANVNAKKLAEFKVPVAPLNEQKRIADKLDVLLMRVDACRERLERIPLILKRFRQAVLTEATSGRLTDDWREQRGTQLVKWETTVLGSIGSVTGGLIKNTKRLAFTLRKPYLRVANVYANRLELDDIAEIGLTEAEFQKTLLLKGDLLIVEGNGSLDQIGRAAIWNEHISDCVHQNHLIRWRSNGNMLPKFALFWLLSPEGRASLVELASTTTGLYNLSISKIASIPVRVPPLDEQHEIVHCVENLFAYADRLEAHYQAACTQIERLTPALLAKAFRGELVPQDPNDEPASALLERIRADRAAQPAKAKRDMTSRKPAMTKMTKESVKEAIRQLPKDKFSFDELRENLTGDYDSLKDILFTLLSEAEPILTQVFDQEERAMRFFRAGK